jgi:hypothetical protein
VTELSNDFRDRCEGIAAEWRIRLGFRAFDRLPADDLAYACGVLVRKPDELDAPQDVQDYFLHRDDWWGVLFPTEPPVVVVHPAQSATRYESTVMHELAHLLLEHPLERVYLAQHVDGARSYNEHTEAEAAYLGSCLQIPRRGLYWAVQKGMNEEEIGRHFLASPALVRWRYNATNLSRSPS